MLVYNKHLLFNIHVINIKVRLHIMMLVLLLERQKSYCRMKSHKNNVLYQTK